ncbi:MAG TPA: translation initiation factor IF-2 [Nitrospiraceae bacterium]|jgi:translation initiation factor IF-2|nr:translation initiation factor IF-2 [Nitrospiraceae bacterium]
MRVYALAKQLGMENRDLIPELKRMGITVASHSSALDDEVVQKVLERLGPKPNAHGKTAGRAAESDAGRGERSKVGTAFDHATGTKPGSTQTAQAAEESSKSDKRRILIKRKRADAVPAEEPASLSTVESAGTSGALIDPLVVSPPAAAHLHAETPAVAHVDPAARPDQPHSIGTTAVSVPTTAGKLAVVPSVDVITGKKKALSLEEMQAEGLKEKAKRARKPGRTREEEELRLREDAARWQDLRAIPVQQRRDDRSKHVHHSTPGEVTKPRRKSFKLTPGMTVKEFAELIGQRPADIMRKLMDMGQMLTFNQTMNVDAAVIIAEESGVKIDVSMEKAGEELLDSVVQTEEEVQLEPRPAVVTIMGHVDHGKTSLLDAIRQTKVAEGEAGGITQHIGAYTVAVRGKQVTFLDTPGHEAFTAMRGRGAKITDIVILVVAADDGVMPQTVEAINHAKAASVPIIVAINKIDKPGANSDRVKNALSEHGLISESWGGDTIMVEVSAKEKVGLDTLLEMILLQSEVLELKADPHRLAKGVVVEAKLERGRGPVATVLVQSGTLRVGDVFVVGIVSGKVRALITHTGVKVQEAGPSIPVEVVGLPGVPFAGDVFQVVKDERVAREIAEDRARKQRTADLSGSAKVTLDDLFAKIKEGSVKELALVIKSDVQGSAEALTAGVEKLATAAVKLRVIHSGVGGITESDVLLAAASNAIIIGFNIRPEPKASALAEQQGVDVRLYTIIYDAMAEIKAAMEGLLEPTLKERMLGRAEVRQVFTVSKAGVIAGAYVVDGTISRAAVGARVIRDNVVVYEGKLGSLRRFKDDVREVQQGYECGISIENFNDVKAGDIIEAYAVDKIAAKL